MCCYWLLKCALVVATGRSIRDSYQSVGLCNTCIKLSKSCNLCSTIQGHREGGVPGDSGTSLEIFSIDLARPRASVAIAFSYQCCITIEHATYMHTYSQHGMAIHIQQSSGSRASANTS